MRQSCESPRAPASVYRSDMGDGLVSINYFLDMNMVPALLDRRGPRFLMISGEYAQGRVPPDFLTGFECGEM